MHRFTQWVTGIQRGAAALKIVCSKLPRRRFGYCGPLETTASARALDSVQASLAPRLFRQLRVLYTYVLRASDERMEPESKVKTVSSKTASL